MGVDIASDRTQISIFPTSLSYHLPLRHLLQLFSSFGWPLKTGITTILKKKNNADIDQLASNKVI